LNLAYQGNIFFPCRLLPPAWGHYLPKRRNAASSFAVSLAATGRVQGSSQAQEKDIQKIPSSN